MLDYWLLGNILDKTPWKTQFVRNGKTQFENPKSPKNCKFYTIQWNLKAPKRQNSTEIIEDFKDLRQVYTTTTLKP